MVAACEEAKQKKLCLANSPNKKTYSNKFVFVVTAESSAKSTKPQGQMSGKFLNLVSVYGIFHTV